MLLDRGGGGRSRDKQGTAKRERGSICLWGLGGFFAANKGAGCTRLILFVFSFEADRDCFMLTFRGGRTKSVFACFLFARAPGVVQFCAFFFFKRTQKNIFVLEGEWGGTSGACGFQKSASRRNILSRALNPACPLTFSSCSSCCVV